MSVIRFLPVLLLFTSMIPSAIYAQPSGGTASLGITPDDAALGSTLHVHGTGFVNFSLITNQLDVTVFDANNNIVEGGSVPADADGTIDAEIDTSDGKYAPGTYSVLASYTYWGVRRDANNRIVCDFCPTHTLPLADSVTFTLDP